VIIFVKPQSICAERIRTITLLTSWFGVNILSLQKTTDLSNMSITTITRLCPLYLTTTLENQEIFNPIISQRNFISSHSPRHYRPGYPAPYHISQLSVDPRVRQHTELYEGQHRLSELM